MRMLGIDPGMACTGWGIVEQNGHELRHLGHGQIRTTTSDADHHRLDVIFRGITAVCDEFAPDAASIESVFVSKNPQSALKLGMARGVAMAACASQGLLLNEVAPRLAKKAVTGTGRADKKQMQAMVAHHLRITPKGADAADALGLAIAGLHHAANGALLDDRQARGGSGLAAAIAAALAKEDGKG